MKDEGKRRISRVLSLLLFSSFILHPSSFASAAPTQKEVLKSINESVGHSIDENSFLGFALAVVAMILLLVILSHRRHRTVQPRKVNHPGKLLKEISRTIHLKPTEVRQLKLMSEGMDVSSPLVLMLCPSLMSKAVKENADRIDRRVVGSLAQKIVPGRGKQTSDSK